MECHAENRRGKQATLRYVLFFILTSLFGAMSFSQSPVLGPAKAPALTPLERRLEQLHTPVAQIDLRLSPKSEPAPLDVASGMRRNLIPVAIMDEGYSVRPTSRYAVCACQQPLYFEEIRLERCGRTCGCAQTVVSAGAFMANAILLPYRVASEPYQRVGCGHGDCPSGCNLPCLEPTKPSAVGIASESFMLVGLMAILL